MFYPGSSFECFMALALLLFQLVRSFKAKEMYLKEDRSGFEPESPVHLRT
jgi:hypothetical protein